jgi:hypothetical protein
MAQVVPGAPRVLLSGQPAATMTDLFPIAACPFTPAKPSPCLTIRWLAPSARILINGAPALLHPSAALCLSPEQAPQGPPIVSALQVRVLGT